MKSSEPAGARQPTQEGSSSTAQTLRDRCVREPVAFGLRVLLRLPCAKDGGCPRRANKKNSATTLRRFGVEPIRLFSTLCAPVRIAAGCSAKGRRRQLWRLEPTS